MATTNLLDGVGLDGDLLEGADGVERRRVGLLHRECQSKNGSDKERNVCASHVPALPRGETRKSYQGSGR